MLLKNAKRIIILIIGLTVVVIGIALIVLPGPAFIVIPAGLAILGTEFVWAKRILNKMKRKAKAVAGKCKAGAVYCPQCECELCAPAAKKCPDCGAAIHPFEVSPEPSA